MQQIQYQHHTVAASHRDESNRTVLKSWSRRKKNSTKTC